MITPSSKNKNYNLIQICALVGLSILLSSPVVMATETGRTAEAMLSRRTHTDIPSPTRLNPTQVKQTDTKLPVAQNPVVKKEKKPSLTSSQTVNGVIIEVQSCRYVPEYKSITCNIKLTNQGHDADAVIHCYTGTMAKDNSGNNLQCAHVWIGSNHSWNFAQGKLLQGKPVKGMVRLETKQPILSIQELIISVNFKGTRRSVTVNDIPVR